MTTPFLSFAFADFALRCAASSAYQPLTRALRRPRPASSADCRSEGEARGGPLGCARIERDERAIKVPGEVARDATSDLAATAPFRDPSFDVCLHSGFLSHASDRKVAQCFLQAPIDSPAGRH